MTDLAHASEFSDQGSEQSVAAARTGGAADKTHFVAIELCGVERHNILLVLSDPSIDEGKAKRRLWRPQDSLRDV